MALCSASAVRAASARHSSARRWYSDAFCKGTLGTSVNAQFNRMFLNVASAVKRKGRGVHPPAAFSKTWARGEVRRTTRGQRHYSGKRRVGDSVPGGAVTARTFSASSGGP
jgi:hypothetical protein